MKLSIDPNGWVIHIDDLDVFNISRDQAELLKKIPYTNLLTVIHNKSKLTLDQYHHFAQQIFEGLNNDLPAKEKVFVEGTNKEVIRVTGRKDDNGEMLGLFGMKDNLPWHCNEPGRIAHERPDALCLYAVEHTKGSATLFSNSILALKDLRESTNAPAGLLENLDKIYCFYDYQGSTDNGPTASDVNYRGRTGFSKSQQVGARRNTLEPHAISAILCRSAASISSTTNSMASLSIGFFNAIEVLLFPELGRQ